PARLSHRCTESRPVARGIEHRCTDLWRRQCRQYRRGAGGSGAESRPGLFHAGHGTTAGDRDFYRRLCMNSSAYRLLALDGAINPFGLGAHADAEGVFFSVFSAHAEAVELCLFDATGAHEIARLSLPDNSDGVWHGFLPKALPGLIYGYRAHGPYEPLLGHRFNPHKLLLDPYARQLAGRLHWHDALYGFNLQSANADLSFDRQDSAPYMPRAVVCAETFDWGDDRPPCVPWHDTVIYELHVRGFTKLRDDLPAPIRGTFAALGHASTIAYLKNLGITTVE